MQRLRLGALAFLAGLLLAGCGGGNYEGGITPPPGLGELEYSLVVDPGSSIPLTAIEGELVESTTALAAHGTSALPSGYTARQGMHFTPHSAPAGGFSGRLTVRLAAGDPPAGEYDGVLLYLYYIDPATKQVSLLNTGRGTAGNYVSFTINALGYFVIAENTTIARPGGFTVSAFADLASAPIGSAIQFWALTQNGSTPYSLTWNFGDGSHASGAQVSHVYTVAGVYNVELTAIDGAGRRAPAVSTPIEITQNPSGVLGIDSISVVQDSTNHLRFNYGVTLSGGAAPFSYRWRFENPGGNELSGAAAMLHEFPAEGLYFGEVTVEDSTGASITESFVSDARWLRLDATLREGYAPLVASISITALGFTSADLITLDLGNGTELQNPTSPVEQTYGAPGVYLVRAISARGGGGENYPHISNELEFTVYADESAPLIQLTQPLVPAPSKPFKIIGYNFGDDAEVFVPVLNGIHLEVLSWLENVIEVQVPQGISLSGGRLALEHNGVEVSNHLQLTLNANAKPAGIQGVLPPVAVPGSRVLVTGHGFPKVDTVLVDNQVAVIERQHQNALLASLPGGLEPGAYNLLLVSGAAQLAFPISIIAANPASPPVLGSVTPAVQEAGQGSVVLTGSNLGSAGYAFPFAAGQVLPRESHTAEVISLSDPHFSLDSWVCVVNRDQVSNARELAYMARPQITAVTPSTAAIGDIIEVMGNNFGIQATGDEVLLGDIPLATLTWTDTIIRVQLVSGAKDGQLVVAKKLTSNAYPLIVIPATPGQPGGGQI